VRRDSTRRHNRLGILRPSSKIEGRLDIEQGSGVVAPTEPEQGPGVVALAREVVR